MSMLDRIPTPGRAWDLAPAKLHETEHEVFIAIEDRPFTADMFHMLPDTRDWISLLLGDLRVLGRCYLDRNFLDLVVTDDANFLKAVSIPWAEIDTLHPRVAEFLHPLRLAKPVRIEGHEWFEALPVPDSIIINNKKEK